MTVDELVKDVPGARQRLLWQDAPDVTCDACGRRIYPPSDHVDADISSPVYRPHQIRSLAEAGFDHTICYYCASRQEKLSRFFARVYLRGHEREHDHPGTRPLWGAAL